MRLSIFCTTFWDDKIELADQKAPELLDWFSHVRSRFPECRDIFFATGCRDNPSLNPVPGVPMISSGAERTRDYDVFNWSYFLCAFTAALWRMNFKRGEWDLLLEIESNVVIDSTVSKKVEEFLQRPELIMAPAWSQCPDFNFLAMKPDAVSRFLHNRRRENLCESKQHTMLAETELRMIFQDRWWNPWPEIPQIRQEYGVSYLKPAPDSVAIHWPIVALPSPAVRQHIHLK